MVSSHDEGIGNFNEQWYEQRRTNAFKLSQLETAEPSRNYARVPGYKKMDQKKKRKEKKNQRRRNPYARVRRYKITSTLLRYMTLKTKVFGDYNHARVGVSWITPTRGLLLRGYTGREHGRCKQPNFSLSVFVIWVERLSL